MRFQRLTQRDRELGRTLFTVMAQVFDEGHGELSDEYLDRLLERPDFWALAALDGDEVVGGLTGHTLPMTRSATFEVFIYDLAVRREYQRQGIGRRLVAELQVQAAAHGIDTLFVPADNDDHHALDFYRAIGGAAAPVTIFTFTNAQAS